MARYEEVSECLLAPDALNDTKRFRDLSRERVKLEPIVSTFQSYRALQHSIKDNEEALQDPELAQLAEQEIDADRIKLIKLEESLQHLLIPEDPNDACNVFIELRAAAGGNEAAIFVGDLFRAYARFSESKGWSVEILSTHPSEQGGFKEVIAHIVGVGVYAQLKFESGAHRVQRVPKTEVKGRIHTSTCTVAILPEIEVNDQITISPADLKVDTFRASGAGGQHVQKTDSAIRITHLPTGLVIECQDERSQHKNRARAMSLLQAKLIAMQRAKHQQEQAQVRRNLVGTGDRSERIRTYNFPQSRVTDHRINLTLYQLSDIMEGNFQFLIDQLRQAHEADQLIHISED